MLPHTALTEAVEKAGVTPDQARIILEAAGVKVQPDLPTEPGSVIIATEVRGKKGEWMLTLDYNGIWYGPKLIAECRWHRPDRITKWTEATVVPKGEKIDPKGDVRVDDQVRLVLNNGDEATITVTRADMTWIDSYHNTYLREAVHAIYLLDQSL